MIGYKLLALGSLYYSGVYLLAFVLRLINNEWAMTKWMPGQFPLLYSWNLDKTGQLFNLGLWTIVSPVLVYGLWTQNTWLVLLMCLISVWEVILGATFYVEIGKGFREHMILHSIIVGYIVSKFI